MPGVPRMHQVEPRTFWRGYPLGTRVTLLTAMWTLSLLHTTVSQFKERLN